ncbi:hypothetical protein JTE90_003052 [Oedothorax gibbosus]|uniref:Uncharacterized protein n=1 Tax=Oedothorax gibbosus TaxID=931172 RepID=A0AAV6VDQ2_9ARAC|nr:hypothetical protein JTE90_003052 [Oedothorax gibbosus]
MKGATSTEKIRHTKISPDLGVVQIQKIKNATAPKYEYGSGAPPILRLLLTDGNTHINCCNGGNGSLSVWTFQQGPKSI